MKSMNRRQDGGCCEQCVCVRGKERFELFAIQANCFSGECNKDTLNSNSSTNRFVRHRNRSFQFYWIVLKIVNEERSQGLVLNVSSPSPSKPFKDTGPTRIAIRVAPHSENTRAANNVSQGYFTE